MRNRILPEPDKSYILELTVEFILNSKSIDTFSIHTLQLIHFLCKFRNEASNTTIVKRTTKILTEVEEKTKDIRICRK